MQDGRGAWQETSAAGAVTGLAGVGATHTGVGAAASALATESVVNNSNIPHGDIHGFSLPAGTTDEQGIAACTKYCEGSTACSAWVYVRPSRNGPRCAIKGNEACENPSSNQCSGCNGGPPNSRCDCISGTKPATKYKPCNGGGGGGGGGKGQGFSVPYAHDESFDGKFALRVLVDRPVLEVYAQSGRAIGTYLYLPAVASSNGLALVASNGTSGGAVTACVDVFAMGSAFA